LYLFKNSVPLYASGEDSNNLVFTLFGKEWELVKAGDAAGMKAATLGVAEGSMDDSGRDLSLAYNRPLFSKASSELF
jgi:hypothetical protein